MAIAANRLGEIKGGFVVVEDGKVTGEIALPVAGLMSLEPFEVVRDTLHDLRQAFLAQRCLSLFRDCYSHGEYSLAKGFYFQALRADWRTFSRWSYTRKALRLLFR